MLGFTTTMMATWEAVLTYVQRCFCLRLELTHAQSQPRRNG